MLKNITLSAEEEMIERARVVASLENRSLNQAFREWLEHYQARADAAVHYAEVMKKLSQVKAGKNKYTRDQLNSR